MYIVGNWVISLHLEISDDFNSIDYCHGVLALLVGFRLQTMAASQRIFRFPEKKKIEDETKRILFSTVNHFFYIQILSQSSVDFVQPGAESLNRIQFCTGPGKAGTLRGSGGTGYGNCFFGLVAGQHGARHVGRLWRIFGSIRAD
jgi:hypothetical protein